VAAVLDLEDAVGAVIDGGSFTGRVGDLGFVLVEGDVLVAVLGAAAGLLGFLSAASDLVVFVIGFEGIGFGGPFLGDVGVFGGMEDFGVGFVIFFTGLDFGMALSSGLLAGFSGVLGFSAGSDSGSTLSTTVVSGSVLLSSDGRAMLPLRGLGVLFVPLDGLGPSIGSRVDGRLDFFCTSPEFVATTLRAIDAPNSFSAPASIDGVSMAASGMVSVT
jgi:hypothetical protein